MEYLRDECGVNGTPLFYKPQDGLRLRPEQLPAAELATGTVAELVELLPHLTASQLAELETLERDGSARVTLLSAIEDELNKRS